MINDDLLMRLARLSDHTRYGSTWGDSVHHNLLNNLECLRYWLPMFWLTPLASGLKEGALSKVDRVFLWAQPCQQTVNHIVSRFAFDMRLLPRLPFEEEIESVAQLYLGRFKEHFSSEMSQASNLYHAMRDCTDVDFSLAIKPNIIGAVQYDYEDGIFFNGNTLKYIRLLHNMLSHAPLFSSPAPIVMEIGAGYGGLIELIANHFPSCRFVIIDIPETLAISSYYLLNTFPKMTWKLHDSNEKVYIDKYQLNFIPNDMANNLHGEEIDIVINSNSFVEMPHEEITKYFDLIQKKNTVKYFWYSNGVNSEYAISTLSHMPFDDDWEIVLDQMSFSKEETGMEKVDFASKYSIHHTLLENKELLLRRVQREEFH